MQLLEQTELPKPEEKITLYGVTWEQYNTLVSMFMDRFVNCNNQVEAVIACRDALSN